MGKASIIPEDKRNSYFKVDISRVHEEEGFNARVDYGDLQELKNSIIQNGILLPLRANKVNGEWFIVDGHRRYRAAKLAVAEGHDILIPLMVQPIGNNAEDRLIEMLVTATGKPLEPFEQAVVYKRLIAHGWSEKQIAERIGKSQSSVKTMLKFNELDKETKDMVADGKVSTSAAVESIAKVGVAKTQEKIKAAVKEKGSVTSRQDLGLSKKVSTDKLKVLAVACEDEGNTDLALLITFVEAYMNSELTLQECITSIKGIEA